MNADNDAYRHSLQGERQARRADEPRALTHLLYALYLAGWITGGISVLVAIIANYARRADAQGTSCEAHFTWQIRTFWIGVVWALAGVALLVYAFVAGGFAVFRASSSGSTCDAACVLGLTGVALGGALLMGGTGVYLFYRIIKGWLCLYWNKPLSNRYPPIRSAHP